jgi:hypothetical protein
MTVRMLRSTLGSRRGCAAAALLGLVIGLACEVSTDILFERTYFCDGTALTETCGANHEGEPMLCYQARQIGARDFCTDRCLEGDPDASGPGWRCVDTKARLITCRPSDGAKACPRGTPSACAPTASRTRVFA